MTAPVNAAALQAAWEAGAKAGHHSPLTWFALRQCNPYRTEDKMMDTQSSPHDPACETHAGHLPSGYYCCDTYAVDHVWGTS